MSTVLVMLLLFGVAIALMGAFVVASVIRTNNDLAVLGQRCDAAKADIDAHLKHRANLIPGLVETVKGFAGHERTVLAGVTDARAGMAANAGRIPDIGLAAMTGQDVPRLLAMAETYPEIAASPHFRGLRDDLVECENRITASRRYFNVAVAEYNSAIQSFPGSWLAGRKRLSTRTPYDLGVERVLLDEPVAVKF